MTWQGERGGEDMTAEGQRNGRGGSEQELPLDVVEQIDQICDRLKPPGGLENGPGSRTICTRSTSPTARALAAELLASEASRPAGGWASQHHQPMGRLLCSSACSAIRPGLIGRTPYPGGFRPWAADKSQPLGQYLAASALDDSHRSLLDALVVEHFKRQGGDVTRSLAVLPAGRSTLEQLRAGRGTRTSTPPWLSSARPSLRPIPPGKTPACRRASAWA